MTHRGPFQPLPFCDSVKAFFFSLFPSAIDGKRQFKGSIRNVFY